MAFFTSSTLKLSAKALAEKSEPPKYMALAPLFIACTSHSKLPAGAKSSIFLIITPGKITLFLIYHL